jgi:fucose 4-O-acetylase-like acetyltransferase
MTYYKWIDIAKGIGILCVVVGHAINQLNPENVTIILLTIRNVIYSFHMPLFFFLSGFLLNYSTTTLEFIRKKVKRLVVPYFFAYILISIFLCISYILIKVPDSFSGFHYFLGMLYGTLPGFMAQTGTDIFNPLWFLPSLFCALIISYMLLRVFERDPLLGSLSLIVTICVGYACGIRDIHLPWGFDIALVALIFVIPGFYLKKSGNAEIKNVNAFSMGVIFLGFVVAFYLNPIPAMAVGDYYDLFLFWVEAGCAIIGVWYLSCYLVFSPLIERTLSFFGKNSLVILCFHTLSNVAIHYVALVFPPALGIYYSNVIFEIFCMLLLSIAIIFIIQKIPIVNRIFYSV